MVKTQEMESTLQEDSAFIPMLCFIRSPEGYVVIYPEVEVLEGRIKYMDIAIMENSDAYVVFSDEQKKFNFLFPFGEIEKFVSNGKASSVKLIAYRASQIGQEASRLFNMEIPLEAIYEFRGALSVIKRSRLSYTQEANELAKSAV